MSLNPANCGYGQAMGLVPRDVNVANGFMGSAAACNIEALRSAINYVQSLSFKELMILTYNNETTTSYDLEPRGSLVTVFQFDNVINVATTINLSIIGTGSSVGDTIYIMLVTSSSGNVLLNYDSSIFLTRCGGITNTETVNNNFRFIRRFVYDGEFWVNTDDNC